MFERSSIGESDSRRQLVCYSTNPAEQREWLISNPGWQKLDLNILDALILRFASTSMFEVFLATSQELSLVDLYRGVAEQAPLEHRDEVVVSAIAAHLAQAGNRLVSVAAKHMARKEHAEAMEPARIAQNALDSALILDGDQLPAYVGKAILARVSHRHDECAAIARRGLERAEEMAAKRPAKAQSPFGAFLNFDAAKSALASFVGSSAGS